MYHRKRIGYGKDYYPEFEQKGHYDTDGYSFNDYAAITHIIELHAATEISIQSRQHELDREIRDVKNEFKEEHDATKKGNQQENNRKEHSRNGEIGTPKETGNCGQP
jgi:hypothetical protein